MGHVCPTCGIEMPSPGGLAVHELSHLTDPPPPPTRAEPPVAVAVETKTKAPKERTKPRRRPGEKKAPVRAVVVAEQGDGPRATAPEPPPTEPLVEPAGEPDHRVRGRRKLDSTVPLTALLVLVILLAGVAAALTHSPSRVNVATADQAPGAGVVVVVPGSEEEVPAPPVGWACGVDPASGQPCR